MKKKLDSSREPIKQVEIDELFSQLTTHEVEQFYNTYHLWLKHQQITHVQQEISDLKEKQTQNAILLHDTTPSAVALAALAQLRASGVEEVDLLDRMLERGEEWLDHTLQLLERCEELNVIRGNYTQWCEHALDGAYEWMGSMDDASLHDYFHSESTDSPSQPLLGPDPADTVTEGQLLLKLMSDEDNIANTIPKTKTVPLERITQKLPPLASNEDEDSLDFPVEIEEPEIEPVESDINIPSQVTDEQLADQEDKQPDEQTAYMEDLFPVEIEEPVSDAPASMEQEPLADKEIDPEIQYPDEVQEATTQAEIHTEIVPDTTPEILDYAPDEPVLLIDQLIDQSEEAEPVEPVLLIDQPEGAEPIERETATLEVDEHHDSSKDEDSSTPTDIQLDDLVEPASSPSDTAQDEESSVLIPNPTADLIDPQLPIQEPDDAPESVSNTTVDEATDSVEKDKNKSQDQWPFAYQEAETPIEAATYNETLSPESGSDAEQLSVDPALKKPQDEAFSKSSTKKKSWIGNVLANFRRR